MTATFGTDSGAAPRYVNTGQLSRRLPAVSTRLLSKIIIGVCLTGILIAWEALSRLGIVEAQYVSRPTDIAAAVPDLVRDPRLRSAAATTGITMLKATAYGVVLGTVLGYLLGTVRLLRDAFFGSALFLLSVPKSIFIPIFLVTFGVNTQTAVYYGAYSAVVYVLVNVVGGIDLIQPEHTKIAYAYNARLRHRIMDLILPASAPGVFAGVWYGIKNGLQGVLILEFFVSVGGLGSIITSYTNARRPDRVFAVILGISLCAIALGSMWSKLERSLGRWRPEESA